ncbi:MAG: RHS repeat domain-containing protein [Candidatus Methylumidiphilus sp.]
MATISAMRWAILLLSVWLMWASAAVADTTPDAPGNVSTSASTIGAEKFAVDPRTGVLDYSFTFFQGSVNYGQTPFSLALEYQQTAAGSYIGEFSTDTHAHPYGVSAYVPTPPPKATLSGNYDDSGAVWDLNLPAVFISTGKVSKFYGSKLIPAVLSLNGATYTYLLPFPSISNTSNPNDYVPTYTTNLINAGNSGALYGQESKYLTFSNYDSANGSFQVQDKAGVNYVFQFAVLYGYKGVGQYQPGYQAGSGSDPTADESLVYRIVSITYPTGQSLKFSYSDDFSGNTSHKVTVNDTLNNTLATVTFSGQNATVAIANQQGKLANLYGINFDGLFRPSSISNLSNGRSWSFTHQINQAVPYSWNNQTALVTIANNYTGMKTQIGYAQFNSNSGYDAGCNSFSLADVAVASVTNSNANGTLNVATYNYGFSNTKQSNFFMPQASGKHSYASGLSHWLDNVFYAQNQDSGGCGSSDVIDMSQASYGTTIATTFYGGAIPDPRNAVQALTYDAFGRMTENILSKLVGNPIILSSEQYNYAVVPLSGGKGGHNPASGAVYSTFSQLPRDYAAPASKTTSVNTCWVNGVTILSQLPTQSCNVNLTESWTYDANGNTTQHIAPTGQEIDYTYWPASSTIPQNERLPGSTTTYSIGHNAQNQRSSVIQSQTYNNLSLAPAASAPVTATLPTATTEQHFDMNAPQNGTYTYRSSSMGYVTGNPNLLLYGMPNQRQQTDGTNVSDVKSLSTQFAPSMVTFAGQNALRIGYSLSGQANGGANTLNAGSSLLNRMGYVLQNTNALGQVSAQTYDNYARILTDTRMQGTAYAQTTRYSYDDALSLCASPCAGAKFSIRETDPLGNQDIRLYDYRLRPVATYRRLAGAATVLAETFTLDDSTGLVTRATRYGRCDSGCANGAASARTVNYYYMPGTRQVAAAVPNVGLAQGQIIDGVNGNTLTFSYVPAANAPTTIQKIVGGVAISHVDSVSGALLYDGVVSAEAATTALAGVDFVNVNPGGATVLPGLKLWLGNSAGTVPALLAKLYSASGQHAPGALTPQDNLLAFNHYGLDEWNRPLSVDNYTFPNNAAGLPTTQKNTTRISLDAAHRAETVTYPQGQQQTSVRNLLDGLQSATLTVNGKATALGNFQHDGLGRVVQFNDTLNGANSKSTWTYDSATGLLTGGTDAYGNVLSLLYSKTSYQTTQSTITPATSGPTVVVNKAYDRFGRVTNVSDNLGNAYARTYFGNGLLASSSKRYAGQPTAYLTRYSYDAYGDLQALSDPFLPAASSNPGLCFDTLNPASPYGYAVSKDSYGRVSQIGAQNYHGVALTLGYDSTTGKINQNTLINLPAQLNVCGPGRLSVATSYTYDNYLRPTQKTVSANNGTATFTQGFDLAGHIVSTTRLDIGGASLIESYNYDPVTGALLAYRNNSADTAKPYGYASVDGPIGSESYAYDLYGNLTQLSAVNPSGGAVMTRSYSYDANNPFRLNSISEARPSGGFTGQYAYDSAGNATADGFGRRFRYNAQGRLAAIQMQNGKTETLTYDGLGQLTQKQFTGTPAVSLYGRAQFQTGNGWQVGYLGGKLYYQASQVAGVTGTAAVQSKGVANVADLGGRVTSTMAYGTSTSWQVLGSSSQTPYGVMTNLLGGQQSAGYPANLSSASYYPEAPWGTVQGRETGSGLAMLGGYRAYDPVIGRFLQMDSMSPFGRGGLNGYAYALNNPIAYWDPTGHYAKLKHKRYGPKPPSGHHSSGCGGGGGFWGGFVSGMCKAFTTAGKSIYEMAKSDGELVKDLATGNFAGYAKGLEQHDMAIIKNTVNTVRYTAENPGGSIGTLMFEEMNLKPTNILQGKSPYHKYHVSAYEAGFTLGEAGTADAIELVAMLVFDGVAGALENAAEAAEADGAVMADAESSGGDTLPSADNGNVDNDNASAEQDSNGGGHEDNGSGDNGAEHGKEGGGEPAGHGGEAENGPAEDPGNAEPHSHAHESKMAEAYKTLKELVEATDHAHTFLSQTQERSEAYEESQKKEKEPEQGGVTYRNGFGQIGMDSGYQGLNPVGGSTAPNLYGTQLFGAGFPGSAVVPTATPSGNTPPYR